MKMAVMMNPMAENGSLGGILNNFRIRLVIILIRPLPGILHRLFR